MGITYDIDPAIALVRGLDRILITLTNWGNTDPATEDAGAQSVRIADQNYSLAGLAILPNCPRLDNVNQPTIGAMGSSILFQSSTGYGSSQMISVGAPFIGDIPGPWYLQATSESVYGATYAATTTGAATAFGPSMGNNAAGVPIFCGNANGHLMQLIAYLRPPANVPLTRMPLLHTAQNRPVNAGTLVQHVYCVSGRREISLVANGSVGGVCDVMLTGLLGGAVREFALTQPIPLNGEQEARFNITTPPDLYWLMVKTTLVSGAPRLQWQFAAVD